MSNVLQQNDGLENSYDFSAEFLQQQQKLVEHAWNQQDPRKIAQDLNALMQSMLQMAKS